MLTLRWESCSSLVSSLRRLISLKFLAPCFIRFSSPIDHTRSTRPALRDCDPAFFDYLLTLDCSQIVSFAFSLTPFRSLFRPFFALWIYLYARDFAKNENVHL